MAASQLEPSANSPSPNSVNTRYGRTVQLCRPAPGRRRSTGRAPARRCSFRCPAPCASDGRRTAIGSGTAFPARPREKTRDRPAPRTAPRPNAPCSGCSGRDCGSANVSRRHAQHAVVEHVENVDARQAAARVAGAGVEDISEQVAAIANRFETQFVVSHRRSVRTFPSRDSCRKASVSAPADFERVITT